MIDQPDPVTRRGRPPLDPGARRQRILDAAAKIFQERGFEDTTVDMVSRSARVTKRTIYELIGDKEALFRAVCNESSSSSGHLRFPQVEADMSPHDVFTELARALLEHALSPARVAVSRMIMIESMRFPDLARNVLGRGKSIIDAGIISVFEQLESHGITVVPDHARAAEIFYDVLIGNLGFRVTLGFEGQAMTDDELNQRLDVFIRGYLRN